VKRLLLLPSLLVACTDVPAADGDLGGESTLASESESESESDTETDETETETETGDPEPLCPSDGLGPGDHVLQLEHDGRSRVFQVHVPPGYDGSVATPLVVNFHGLGSNGTQQAFFSNMNPTADAEGFVVVYPEGTVNAGGERAWNGGGCCTDDPTVDDVGFIRAMLDELDTQLCIDHDRRFATGMSNGGLMSYRIGCEAADLFAAVAPVAGLLSFTASDCNPARPVPLWQIHGTIDELVPFEYARDSAELWAQANGCTTQTSVSYQNGVVTCDAWDCPAGAEVVFCTAEGINHCWPGQPFCVDPPSTEDIDSTATIWAYFAAHPMPR
jgi:polyhydroxybutyrate depolymerase